MTVDTPPSASVTEAFALDPESLETLPGGHINRSFAAMRGAEACVLQRLHPVFPASINDDIDAVTRHLAASQITTPRLLTTTDGQRWLQHGEEVWRLLTRIPGTTHESLRSTAEAQEAGRILGVFHAALDDFDHPLGASRPGVHDLKRHLAVLANTLATQTDHRAHSAVAAVADALFALNEQLAPLPQAPLRLVHGDPKISNVIFEGDRAVCLIDLDTLARLPVAIELGDALRSWCNPAGEDAPDAHFVVDRFDAALTGYAAATSGLLGDEEWQAIPGATLAIAVELAARFATDALNEAYFSWDRDRFGSAAEHNLARARAQLALARSLQGVSHELAGRVVTFA